MIWFQKIQELEKNDPKRNQKKQRCAVGINDFVAVLVLRNETIQHSYNIGNSWFHFGRFRHDKPRGISY